MSRRQYQYVDGAELSRPRPHARPSRDDLNRPALRPPVSTPAELLAQATPTAAPAAEPHQLKPKAKRFRLRVPAKKLAVTLGVAVVVIALASLIYSKVSQPGVVPKKFTSQLSFPVYYPDPKKLPAGYKIDENSFTSPQKGVLLYDVDYGNGQKLIIANQAQPSNAVIQNFYTDYIPLRNQMNTILGQAQIGAYGSGKNLKTIVSLPTNKKTWVIITAPYDVNQDQLKQVLDTLKT